MCFPSYPNRFLLFVCLSERFSYIPEWSSTYCIVDDGLELLLLLPRPPKCSDYKHGQFLNHLFFYTWIVKSVGYKCVSFMSKPQTLNHGYSVLLMPLIQCIDYLTFLVWLKAKSLSSSNWFFSETVFFFFFVLANCLIFSWALWIFIRILSFVWQFIQGRPFEVLMTIIFAYRLIVLDSHGNLIFLHILLRTLCFEVNSQFSFLVVNKLYTVDVLYCLKSLQKSWKDLKKPSHQILKVFNLLCSLS